MIIGLAACSTQPQQIEISSKPIDKPTLSLPPVDELNMRKLEWIVINEANVDAVIAQLAASGKPFAIYGLTGEGFAALGLNFSDIRALVQQQQAIIAAYEGYYEQAEQAMDNAVVNE
jgi:hypothetical protein